MVEYIVRQMNGSIFFKPCFFSAALCLIAASVSQAQPVADAGPPMAEVCEGDGFVLGGDPTASGGSGFYMISWSSNPAGFSSSASNPVVTPAENTVYTVTVLDSDGGFDIDVINVKVNPRTDPADLDIVFTPDANSYSIEDDPVDLSYTVGGGGGGSGDFSGNGVNSSSNKFFPNAANIGTNDITLTYTNNDNCETAITEKVNVYDPNGFISGLDAGYCPYGDDDLLVNIPFPYLSFVDISLSDENGQDIPVGTAWTKNIPARTVHLNLEYLPIGRNAFTIIYTILGITGYNYTPYLDLSCLCIKYNITPIFGPVQTEVVVPLIINPQPVTKIAFKAKEPEFCRNDTPITMEGGPAGGIWLGTGITPSPGNDGSPEFSSGDNGLASFDPSAAAAGNNIVRYLFEDDNGCQDTSRVDFMVFDVPAVNFTAGNGCVGIPIEFNPSVTIPGSVSVTGYVWDFGDDRTEASPVLSDPTIHSYSSSNDYDVTFGVSTADGCLASVTKQVSIGDIPDIKLGWSSVCDGDPTRFAIQSEFFSSSPSELYSINWEFGDGNNATKVNPGLPDSVQMYAYTATGYYEANATIETDLGCTNSDTARVYKVARTGIINSDNVYFEAFNGATFADQQWVTGGTNSSWEWGTPSNTLINDDSPGGGKAWVTNLTGSFNINEDSWVHSPCIDLSRIQRPVLSMDIRSLTRSRIEGAVLQVNTSGSTNKESDWKTVGNIASGVNWFNATGIFSNPGNQALNQMGWSGSADSAAWRTAIISLDNTLAPLSAVEKSRMRFRVAFSSPVDSSFSSMDEGFAIDNVLITQRDRVVLLENFTNTGGPDAPDESNKVSNQTINNFVDGLAEEIVKIEYHLSLNGPNGDPVYQDNPVDANARAAFYGITSTPFVLVDGKYGGSVATIYADQTLRSADATIDTIFTTDAPAPEYLNIEATFTAKTDLPPGTALHIAVLEKTISAPEAMGSNGESTLRYAMKKMLPTARGTVFPSGVPTGESRTVNVSWLPQAYNPDSLVVVAFLQHEGTGEVFQARLREDLQFIPSGLVTGLEPSFANRVSVYPVPADNELLVKLPAPSSGAVICRMIDSFGREIASDVFTPGEQISTFDTSGLADGVYILQFEKPDEAVSRKKLLVVHGQGH